jgi:putative transposase
VQSGYVQIQKPPSRYAVVDLRELTKLCGFTDLETFQGAHRQWVEQALENGLVSRDDRWSEAIAVGSRSFVEKVKNELGFKAAHRELVEGDGSYALREAVEAYGREFAAENEALESQNAFLWNETVE